MATPDQRVQTIAAALTGLGALCDTGFALAVHIRLIRPTLLYQTYSDAWSDHYSMKGYMLTDPVVGWGLQQPGRVIWADLQGQDPAGVFRDAVQFGLTNGWTYSTGPASSRTISGATKSGSDFTTAQRDEICRLVDVIHETSAGFDQFPAPVQQALRDLGHRG
jgi:LuxR family transcriptional regulator, quorum-sensing system regulator SdiA